MDIEGSSLIRIAVALEALVKLGKEQQRAAWYSEACEECKPLIESGYTPVMYFDFKKYDSWNSISRRSCNKCFKLYAMRQA